MLKKVPFPFETAEHYGVYCALQSLANKITWDTLLLFYQ